MTENEKKEKPKSRKAEIIIFIILMPLILLFVVIPSCIKSCTNTVEKEIEASIPILDKVFSEPPRFGKDRGSPNPKKQAILNEGEDGVE